MKAVIYLRISTKTQNFDLQEKACLLKAKLLGITKKKIFKDVITGTSNPFKRPGLMDAITALQKGDVFIVRDRKRIARDMTIVKSIEKMILECKAKLVVVMETKVLTKEQRDELDLEAKKELVKIRKATTKALKEKKDRNEITGNIKRGYKRSEDNVHFEEDIEEQERIKRIKQLKKKGNAMPKIVEIMNDDLCNRKPYTLSDVKKILAPPKKKTSNNAPYGVNTEEQQLLSDVYQFHDNGMPWRDILKMVHHLGHRTRIGTPLGLTQIERFIKARRQ
jgi:DNA invertase Pin-like site-specific DNA recombinase